MGFSPSAQAEAVQTADAAAGLSSPLLPQASVDMDEFEHVTREFAAQSLKYGEGTVVDYDMQGLQNWVFENIADNKPKIEVHASSCL